jgi:hypothetical protein
MLLLSALLGVPAAAQSNESGLRDEAEAVDVDVDAPSVSYHESITGKQRLRWAVKGTIGLQSLGVGILTAGQATAQNDPHEYGPHWDGFGKRYGMRLTAVATEHAMEAGLGALWGEDPRYFRSDDPAYRGRIKHVVVSTFGAYQADGHFGPAYARLIAMPGSNFLSNAWRADSVSTTGNAWERTGWGFVGRLGGNAFAEFWPDLKKHLFHRRK